jgi:hypothetical protein
MIDSHDFWNTRLGDLSKQDLLRLLAQTFDTNKHLHRRCQRAESNAVYYARRYEALQRPLLEMQERAYFYTKALKRLYDQEYRIRWRYCVGCRATWWVKWWIRRWL